MHSHTMRFDPYTHLFQKISFCEIPNVKTEKNSASLPLRNALMFAQNPGVRLLLSDTYFLRHLRLSMRLVGSNPPMISGSEMATCLFPTFRASQAQSGFNAGMACFSDTPRSTARRCSMIRKRPEEQVCLLPNLNTFHLGGSYRTSTRGEPYPSDVLRHPQWLADE
jgi:hypothetical protein